MHYRYGKKKKTPNPTTSEIKPLLLYLVQHSAHKMKEDSTAKEQNTTELFSQYGGYSE